MKEGAAFLNLRGPDGGISTEVCFTALPTISGRRKGTDGPFNGTVVLLQVRSKGRITREKGRLGFTDLGLNPPAVSAIRRSR